MTDSETDGPEGKEPHEEYPSNEYAHKREFNGLKRLGANDSHSYVHMRIALDSFQAMALVYYAAGAPGSERDSRADEIRDAVKNTLEPWLREIRSSACPRGYYDCNGLCLPMGVICC